MNSSRFYCVKCGLNIGEIEAIHHQDQQHEVVNLEVAADNENLEEAKK